MAAGTAYAKRYAAGFTDADASKPVDQSFLNAVETALLQLIGSPPTVDGQVAQWDFANTRYGPALLLNKNIDAAAAIAKSKLDLTGANGIVDADIAGAANIAASKIGSGIAASKITGGVSQQLICDSLLTGTSTGFDTNTLLGGNIPSTYSHLRLVVYGRSDAVTARFNSIMRVNNDSGANYDWYEMDGKNAVAEAAQNPGATSWSGGQFCGSSGTASYFGHTDILIPNYAATTGFKSFTAVNIAPSSATTDVSIISLGGFWKSTAAITRISFAPSANNWIIGTRFSLYGIL